MHVNPKAATTVYAINMEQHRPLKKFLGPTVLTLCFQLHVEVSHKLITCVQCNGLLSQKHRGHTQGSYTGRNAGMHTSVTRQSGRGTPEWPGLKGFLGRKSRDRKLIR